ncbi:MAG: hypothetical protein VKI42_10025 [Synechococcaceae cyanobacterium]|nr:hypothetical protein [Synechococcaceae cyanobacterium]
MAQILEVIIAMVVSAMMASAITTLALSPIKTQRQKNIYAASEAASIAVRKCVVDNPTTFKADTDITSANVSSTCLSKILTGTEVSCEVKTKYVPAGTLVSVPYAIECKQTGVTSGNMAGLAWQPLYTVNAMVAAASTLTATDFNTCMTKWLTDSSSTYSGSVAPSSENLASKYPTECSGLKDPFSFTSSGWKTGYSPCAATLKIGTSGTTSTTVRFDLPAKTCSAP